MKKAHLITSALCVVVGVQFVYISKLKEEQSRMLHYFTLRAMSAPLVMLQSSRGTHFSEKEQNELISFQLSNIVELKRIYDDDPSDLFDRISKTLDLTAEYRLLEKSVEETKLHPEKYAISRETEPDF